MMRIAVYYMNGRVLNNYLYTKKSWSLPTFIRQYASLTMLYLLNALDILNF